MNKNTITITSPLLPNLDEFNEMPKMGEKILAKQRQIMSRW